MIRRLKRGGQGSVTFQMSAEEGVLVLVSEQKFEVLYIQNSQSIKIEKVTFSPEDEIKYIGSEKLFHNLENLDSKLMNRIKRVVFTKSAIDIAVNFEQKKLSFDASLKVDARKESAKKKVLIVDDVKTIRTLLTKIVESSPDLEVVATADRPSVALKMIEEHQPDLITLDIHMPEMNGLEFLKKHVKPLRIPTIMISSISASEGPIVMEALANGAATYIEKPSAKNLSEVKDKIVSSLSAISKSKFDDGREFAVTSKARFGDTKGIVCIGSSTGGTRALELIMKSLAVPTPPIVVAQHIPSVFSKALADRLNNISDLEVVEAKEGDVLEANKVYIAPGGNHLSLKKLKNHQIRAVITEHLSFTHFRPSVDHLFDSVAGFDCFPCIGVVLTGMGKDGAKGLLSLKNAGAFTITQDKESCVVYGMPKAAFEIGASCLQMPLCDIPEAVVSAYDEVLTKKSA